MGKKIALRDAFGQALLELGGKYTDIMVLDADLSSATRTIAFAQQFPERHFNVGIAESNMIGVAAGLASCSIIPIASSFAMFSAGRAFEQIRNSVAYPNLNVKIVGTHCGLSIGKDGATHQAIEDMGIMRTIPNMTVLSPSDAVETREALEAAVRHAGPVYLRIDRLAVDVVNDTDDYVFELGKGILKKPGKDLTIVTTGVMLQEALCAREELLRTNGIHARVIHIHTVKPIDKEIIIQAAKETGLIITVENHSVIGGLGSAVAEVISETYPVRVKRMGVQDVFGKSGDPHDLMKEYGLTKDAIIRVAREALEMRR